MFKKLRSWLDIQLCKWIIKDSLNTKKFKFPVTITAVDKRKGMV